MSEKVKLPKAWAWASGRDELSLGSALTSYVTSAQLTSLTPPNPIFLIVQQG